MDNEQAVAEALAKGDKQVLGQFFDQYAPALFGLAVRLTETEQQASVALQNAFQQIVSQARSFDAKKTDLFTWALNLTKQAAQEIGPQGEQFDFVSYQAAHSAGADFRTFVRNLDVKHRRVIELAYFEGLSEPELERAMNFPVGTVNTRLRFAVRELRKILNG